MIHACLDQRHEAGESVMLDVKNQNNTRAIPEANMVIVNTETKA